MRFKVRSGQLINQQFLFRNAPPGGPIRFQPHTECRIGRAKANDKTHSQSTFYSQPHENSFDKELVVQRFVCGDHTADVCLFGFFFNTHFQLFPFAGKSY